MQDDDKKYLYLIPKGGFNDILCRIYAFINYCKRNNRILLIDTIKTTYEIDFEKFIAIPSINNVEIILNRDIIKKICYDEKNVYPNININNLLNNCSKFKYNHNTMFNIDGVDVDLPQCEINERIHIVACCGGGNGYNLFREINFTDNVVEYCKQKYSLIEKPYIAVHIRNTDYTCNYFEIVEKINSNNVYVATDDVNALKYFKSFTHLNIYNFTQFPTDSYRSLHTSNIDPQIKFLDMICDIYIVSMSEKIFSNSKGGFIHLLKQCHKNKDIIHKKFL